MLPHRSARVLRATAAALAPAPAPQPLPLTPHPTAAEGSPPPTPRYVTTPRFEPDDPAAARYLEAEGYVVIQSVLSRAECDEALELLWGWLGKQGDGNMQRGRPQTWGGEANDALFTDAGVITTGGAIHSRVAWFCRGQPRVKQACAPSSLPPAPSLR